MLAISSSVVEADQIAEWGEYKKFVEIQDSPDIVCQVFYGVEEYWDTNSVKGQQLTSNLS